MNKSTLFTAAHKIAKKTAKAVGNYMIALSLALKSLYKEATMKTVSDLIAQIAALEVKPSSGNTINDNKMNMFKKIWDARSNEETLEKARAGIEKMIESGRTSLEELFGVLEKMIKISERVLIEMNTQAELDQFMKDNDCGSEWENDGKFFCYKY